MSKHNLRCLLFIHRFPFFHWVKVCIGCCKMFFSHFGTKKVVAAQMRQVVILYINNFMIIGFGGLSTGGQLIIVCKGVPATPF